MLFKMGLLYLEQFWDKEFSTLLIEPLFLNLNQEYVVNLFIILKTKVLLAICFQIKNIK
jgi:hypothetical protein